MHNLFIYFNNYFKSYIIIIIIYLTLDCVRNINFRMHNLFIYFNNHFKSYIIIIIIIIYLTLDCVDNL